MSARIVARCASSGAQKLMASPCSSPARAVGRCGEHAPGSRASSKFTTSARDLMSRPWAATRRRHQNPDAAVGEAHQRLIAVALLEITMQRQGGSARRR